MVVNMLETVVIKHGVLRARGRFCLDQKLALQLIKDGVAEIHPDSTEFELRNAREVLGIELADEPQVEEMETADLKLEGKPVKKPVKKVTKKTTKKKPTRKK